MSESQSTPDFTEAEVDFIRRGLANPFDGAVAGGISGINWILDRWKETKPLLEFPAFLRYFVTVLGPEACSRIQHFGWPDPWHLPEVTEELLAERTYLLDARTVVIIDRLRHEFRREAVYAALRDDPPIEHPALPATETRLEEMRSAAAAAVARAKAVAGRTGVDPQPPGAEPAPEEKAEAPHEADLRAMDALYREDKSRTLGQLRKLFSEQHGRTLDHKAIIAAFAAEHPKTSQESLYKLFKARCGWTFPEPSFPTLWTKK